jgi:hypothetical protein
MLNRISAPEDGLFRNTTATGKDDETIGRSMDIVVETSIIQAEEEMQFVKYMIIPVQLVKC